MYRQNLPSYFKDGASALLWTFHPNIIFNRTDLFIKRLQIIEVCLLIIEPTLTILLFSFKYRLHIFSGFLTQLWNLQNLKGLNSVVLKVDYSVLV